MLITVSLARTPKWVSGNFYAFIGFITSNLQVIFMKIVEKKVDSVLLFIATVITTENQNVKSIKSSDLCL